jgi:hypothetical protein
MTFSVNKLAGYLELPVHFLDGPHNETPGGGTRLPLMFLCDKCLSAHFTNCGHRGTVWCFDPGA